MSVAGVPPPGDWRTAHVRQILPRTPTISSFFFEFDEPVAFMAGQHMDVRLVAPDGYAAARSYSIASAPCAPLVELAIERLDRGEVSTFFPEVVEVGDAIELRGPIGRLFVWDATDGGPVLLCGGGSGVVPLVSIARHHAARGADTPMVLLLSARTTADAAFAEELASHAARGDGFQFALALTRDDAGVADYHRRIDGTMAADVLARLPEPARHVFVCGSNGFVESATRGLVDAGVDPLAIKTERYGI